VVLIKTKASLDLNPGSAAIVHISISSSHLPPLLIQNIQATTPRSPSNTPSPTTKTFSSTCSLSSPLACLSHHLLHISVELSLPYVCDLFACYTLLSHIQPYSPRPSETAFSNIPALQDLVYGGDISVSILYDTLCDMHYDLRI